MNAYQLADKSKEVGLERHFEIRTHRHPERCSDCQAAIRAGVAAWYCRHWNGLQACSTACAYRIAYAVANQMRPGSILRLDTPFDGEYPAAGGSPID